MKPHIKIDVTAGTLANMTTSQFESLQKHILAEGRWETQTEDVRLSGSDYLGVELTDMFIGIEKDGYTHS